MAISPATFLVEVASNGGFGHLASGYSDNWHNDHRIVCVDSRTAHFSRLRTEIGRGPTPVSVSKPGGENEPPARSPQQRRLQSPRADPQTRARPRSQAGKAAAKSPRGPKTLAANSACPLGTNSIVR